MKIAAATLINDLEEMVRSDIKLMRSYETLALKELNFKADEKTWSVLENLEHLNLYGDYYLPALQKGVDKGKNCGIDAEFKSNWLGEYFAKSMLPREDGSISKMKTFKNKDPKNGNLPLSVLHRFFNQQESLLNLLNQARGSNLTKAKTGTTIGNWVKIRLGDTFRVVVYHNRRHMMQIQRIGIIPENKNVLTSKDKG